MNKMNILAQAVAWAVQGGWSGQPGSGDFPVTGGKTTGDKVAAAKLRNGSITTCYSIIFNHGFCRGLFGEDYLFHVGEMAVVEDPVMYIWNWMEEKAAAAEELKADA